MALHDDVYAVLHADTTLTGLLTGGIHHTAIEIDRQLTPAAFDVTTKELKPCLLLKVSADAEIATHDTAARTLIDCYFYQRSGQATIDAALARVYALLHRQKIGTGVWEIRWSDDVLNQQDGALLCPMHVSRYYATRRR